MASTTIFIRVTGLGKSKLAALRTRARALGISAETYARRLIEDGLTLDRKARTTSFDKLFAPVRARFRRSGMTDSELDKLTEKARKSHHGSSTPDPGQEIP